jgi:hypothetical protein
MLGEAPIAVLLHVKLSVYASDVTDCVAVSSTHTAVFLLSAAPYR